MKVFNICTVYIYTLNIWNLEIVFLCENLHDQFFFSFPDSLLRLAWQHVGALTLSVWSFGLCFVFLGPLKLCNKLGTSASINEDFGMRETETALPGEIEYYILLRM